MKKSKYLNSKKGFTIIEMVIALTIFTIISLMAIIFYVNSSRAYLNSVENRAAMQNIRIAMETITRYAKQSREVLYLGANSSTGNGSIKFNWLDTGADLGRAASGNNHVIAFRKTCIPDRYNREDMKCEGTPGQLGVIGICKVDPLVDCNNSTDFTPLTSSDINISHFSIEPSIGVPLILNITIIAELSEAYGYEKGLGGAVNPSGQLSLKTSVALKGQYY